MLPSVLDRALSVAIVSSLGSVNVACKAKLARQKLRNEDAFRTNLLTGATPLLATL